MSKIKANDVTEHDAMLINALAVTALQETGSADTAAELLVAAAAKLMFRSYPPQMAIKMLDAILQGLREAVQEATN